MTVDGTGPTITLSSVSSANAQPTLTPPSDGSQPETCTVTFAVGLNEPGNATYAILPAIAAITDPAPLSPRDLLDGDVSALDSTARVGQPLAFSTGSLSKQATAGSLACQSAFQVVLAGQDVLGNVGPSLVYLDVTTPDVLPPLFLNGSPLVAATNRSASVAVVINEVGTMFLQLRLGSKVCGTAAVVKAAAKAPGTGTAAGAAIQLTASMLLTKCALSTLC